MDAELRCPRCAAPHTGRQLFCSECGLALHGGVTRPLRVHDLPRADRIAPGGGSGRAREAWRAGRVPGLILLLALLAVIGGQWGLRGLSGLAAPAPAEPAGL